MEEFCTRICRNLEVRQNFLAYKRANTADVINRRSLDLDYVNQRTARVLRIEFPNRLNVCFKFGANDYAQPPRKMRANAFRSSCRTYRKPGNKAKRFPKRHRAGLWVD